jgi:hypothetical protein
MEEQLVCLWRDPYGVEFTGNGRDLAQERCGVRHVTDEVVRNNLHIEIVPFEILVRMAKVQLEKWRKSELD